MNRTPRLFALAVLVALLLAACGSDDGGDLAVADVWARSTADGQMAGAAYMTITGGDEDDRLLSASAPSEIAATTELHESLAVGEGDGRDRGDSMGHRGMDMDRSMTMREIDGLDVPADEDVLLEPGGYHVMLIDLVEPLEAGDTFELTLTFELAGERTVEVEVRDR